MFQLYERYLQFDLINLWPAPVVHYSTNFFMAFPFLKSALTPVW